MDGIEQCGGFGVHRRPLDVAPDEPQSRTASELDESMRITYYTNK
ncbi:hypothetical protein ACQP1G_32310 [Nocardia sp. CA-107356]